MESQDQVSISSRVKLIISRYGVLALGLFLLFNVTQLWSDLPDDNKSDLYPHGIVVIMLLLSHVTHEFKWKKPYCQIMNFTCIAWCIFGAIYIFTH